ncbi:MAG: hypothetical protein M3142_07625 [Bacteroidota bacterium]|nr:hypothetical protein [Bacteroidota bacterium]
MNTPLKLTLVLLLFAYKGVFAQNNLPPVYEIKIDTATEYQLAGNYSQLLEDPKDSFTIEQVTSATFSPRFHQNNTSKTGVNRKIRTFWFRFQIRNALDRDITLYFDNPPFYHSQELYTPTSIGKWQKQVTGNLTHWSQRDGLKYA